MILVIFNFFILKRYLVEKNIKSLILSYICFFIFGMIFFVLLFKRINSTSIDTFYSNIYLSISSFLFLCSIIYFWKASGFVIKKIIDKFL
jgi:hypothetical protein